MTYDIDCSSVVVGPKRAPFSQSDWTHPKRGCNWACKIEIELTFDQCEITINIKEQGSIHPFNVPLKTIIYLSIGLYVCRPYVQNRLCQASAKNLYRVVLYVA